MPDASMVAFFVVSMAVVAILAVLGKYIAPLFVVAVVAVGVLMVVAEVFDAWQQSRRNDDDDDYGFS